MSSTTGPCIPQTADYMALASQMSTQQRVYMLSGHFCELRVLGVMAGSVVQQIEVAHTVDNDNHMVGRRGDLLILLYARVPVSYRHSRRHKPRGKAVRGLTNRIQASLRAGKPPMPLQR